MRQAAPNQTPRPFLSVIVKCYNEEAKIDLCLRSVIAATTGIDTEIIIVDSMSTDRSLELAQAYPVSIVQLTDPADRRCGAVAQLGYQFARGSFVLVIDGDMELLPDFLPFALPLFNDDASLGAVGGRLIEMSDGMEFQERQLRRESSAVPGEVEQITGCGLYRSAAIAEVGYLTDRNLHCYEEFELGLRLCAAGWRMRLLEVSCVRHYGHRDPALRLLVRRWKTRFFHGHGELLREAWRRPYFLKAIRRCRIGLLVFGWWVALAALGLAAVSLPWARVAALALAAMPLLALGVRKRSISRAMHSFLVWQFSAASMIGGLLSARTEPTRAIAGIRIKNHPWHARVPAEAGSVD